VSNQVPRSRLRPTPDVAHDAVLSGVSRGAVFEALRTADAPLPVTDLAERVGLHPNTVRWHLDQLSRDGWVERVPEEAHRQGRPRLLYAVAADAEHRRTTGGHPSDGYRLLADILAGYLSETRADPAAAAAEAGRAWGSYLVGKPAPFSHIDVDDATRRVVGLLDDLGFSPKTSDGGADIVLEACPFREVAQAHPDVACSVHLGLMQGALVELGMPGTAASLEPFGTPHGCRAQIRAEAPELSAQLSEGEGPTS
jgi:predicted ArsR family transcriptional regulator